MRHYRVQLRDIIEAHDAALAYGGLPGIRDVALIQSAIGRPYTGYYRTIHQKAAALAESLARNHGFIDGNKRTAFLITDLFLHRSGYEIQGLQRDRDSELEKLILLIVEERPPLGRISAWFKERLIRT